jgi:hypothetical protein
VRSFPNGTEWVGLFRQIGLGQWFRYFTGAVEILGGVLVLVPRPEAPKMTTRAALLRSREAQKQQAQYDLARVRAGRMKLKRLELA